MSIDKIYRNLGIFLKQIFNYSLKKPIKNFNVENRAQKRIDNPTAAPWHATTQKLAHQIKKESSFKQIDSRDDSLLDRLKSVKVDAAGETNPEYSDVERLDSAKKLPKQRRGAELPFVFYTPESVPPGKITVLDSFDIILSHKKDNVPPEEIAARYKIAVEDVQNLLEYVDIFVALDKDNKQIPLFSPRDSDDSPLGQIKSEKESQISDK